MKNFIKGRWFPLVAVLAAVLLVALVLFICGFRITYAPELESSWDAVSAVAAWGGVLASFIAIWFAIQVPKKIADRQDKITLFEKRYEIYETLCTCYYFSTIIEFIKNVSLLKSSFVLAFYPSINSNDLLNARIQDDRVYSKYNQILIQFKQAKLLFPENCTQHLDSIVQELGPLLRCEGNATKELQERKQAYIRIMNSVQVHEMIQSIKEEIDLSNVR